MQSTCRISKSRIENMNFPAKVFGYLGICNGLKDRILHIRDNSEPQRNSLPFVSSMTHRATPEGIIYSHWSFLKY